MHTIVDEVLSRFTSLANFNALSFPTTKHISGIDTGTEALLYSAVFKKEGRPLIIVKENEQDAENLYHALTYFTPKDDVLLFPGYSVLPFSAISPNRDIIQDRVRVLLSSTLGQPAIVVLSVASFAKKLMPPDAFLPFMKRMRKGETLDVDAFRLYLTEIGYIKVREIEEEGEYAFRGGILDIYSPAHAHPFRVELFDNEVESIRFFAIETQRSIEHADEAIITPVKETIYTEDLVVERVLEGDFPDEVKERFSMNAYFAGSENYLPLFYADLVDIRAYIPNALTFFYNESAIMHRAKTLDDEREILFTKESVSNVLPSWRDAFFSAEYVTNAIHDAVTLSDLPRGKRHEVSFRFKEGKSFKAKVKEFLDYIRFLREEGYVVNLVTNYEEQARRFQDLFDDAPPPVKHAGNEVVDPAETPFIITLGNLNEGFISEEMRYALLVDREVFGRRKKVYRRTQGRVKKSIIESFVDMNEGDYVVHINHGVGIYKGLTRIEVDGKAKDYLMIEYAKEDKLYIPVEQLNFVQKYLAGEPGSKHKLDTLGGKAWEKVKARAKKAAEDMAKDLAKIYGMRRALRGFTFPKDTTWQEDFEASFPYQETPDQIRAVEDIKEDMERAESMDRLVCGDVGFGKTEVALRAAFKAIMAGKQVAFLCPTTVLSQQHFHTAVERFRNYPVRVELLNRFRSYGEQKRIIHDTAAGKTDLLIGTHKILGEQVKFKELGLIMVDEEQRFGVKHKEKLKEYKVLVDVLTLTATPIPRTLNLSLTKIRDISVIETPPLNRLPIQTYVIEFDEEIMVDAIRKEIRRGGQVFFVYNRVETIHEFATMVRKFIPEAVVGVAHGQMDGRDLERVMVDFINETYNVLVTTAIIENGIDIPNCNTILIHRADRFGLSQLYQLRGRVGRSNKEAYAYFFYPKDMEVSETARKRLRAIAEHTDLGSGFKIAMRDLEIRGAGNLLGKEQSGHIHAVGYELYTQLLEEAVAELKGEEREITFDTVIDIKHNVFIPDEYIGDVKEKIEVYKAIMRAENEDDIKDIKESLIDRYGTINAMIESLLSIAACKAYLKKYRVVSVIEGNYNLYIKFNEFSHIDDEKMERLIKKGEGVYLDTKDLNQLVIPIKEDTITWKLAKIFEVVESVKLARIPRPAKKEVADEDANADDARDESVPEEDETPAKQPTRRRTSLSRVKKGPPKIKRKSTP